MEVYLIEIKSCKLNACNNSNGQPVANFCKNDDATFATIGNWCIRIIQSNDTGTPGVIRVVNQKPGAKKIRYQDNWLLSDGTILLYEDQGTCVAHFEATDFLTYVRRNLGISEIVHCDVSENFSCSRNWNSGIFDEDRELFNVVSDGEVEFAAEDKKPLDFTADVLVGYRGSVTYVVKSAKWVIVCTDTTKNDSRRVEVKLITDHQTPFELIPELEAKLDELEIGSFEDCIELLGF